MPLYAQQRLVSNVSVSGVTPTDAQMVLQSTDPGATGAGFVTYHNSASPAVSDAVAFWRPYGKDSAGNDQLYGNIILSVLDPTSTSEDSAWEARTNVAGANAARIFIGAGIYHGSATGGDQGANTVNYGAVYDDGVLLTCMPLHPEMGPSDWDNLTPNRTWAAEYSTEVLEIPFVGKIAIEREVIPERLEVTRHRTAARWFEMRDAGYDPDDWRSLRDYYEATKSLPGHLTLEEWRARMVTSGVIDKPSIGEYATRTVLSLDLVMKAFLSLAQEFEDYKAAQATPRPNLRAVG